ncbi:MAG: hypothetical protein HY671_11525 [Chloroflexi bacterium]|nr:hypothetical protein [Chloroflexota bacterium]
MANKHRVERKQRSQTAAPAQTRWTKAYRFLAIFIAIVMVLGLVMIVAGK